MPKQVFKLTDFHGGLNSNADPRDIALEESPVLSNLTTENIGKLRVSGKTEDHSEVQSPAAANIASGFGLFVMSHDRTNANQASVITGTESKTDYLLHTDTTNCDVSIYNKSTDAWGEGLIDVGGTTGSQNIFTYLDGALRVSDASGKNGTKWYGYLDKKLYDGIPTNLGIENGGTNYGSGSSLTIQNHATSPTNWLDGAGTYTTGSGGAITGVTLTYGGGGFDSIGQVNAIPNVSGDSNAVITGSGNIYKSEINGWYSLDNEIESPNFGENGTTAPANGNRGFNINITTASDASSSWVADTYQIAFSLVYDGNQESLLYIPQTNHTFTVAEDYAVRMSVYMRDLTQSTALSKRVMGGRVYFKVLDSDDEWKLLADMNVEKGLRATLTTNDWATWGEYAANDLKTSDSTTAGDNYRICTSLEMNTDTYSSINGYDPDEPSIHVQNYTCSTVVGRTMYVANVKRKTELNKTEKQSDAMYKSIVNKFDVFPYSSKIEVNVEDGEDIVALENFADRILQYKNKTLYIINVSGSYEFLESQHKHMGVNQQSAVCKTEFGVAWANQQGAYLYDGRQIINLLEKNNIKVIATNTWNSFFTSNGSVGYSPKSKQIIFLGSTSGSSNVYVYNIVTKSWEIITGKFGGSTNKSNFAVDWNNDLIYSYNNSGTPAIQKYSPYTTESSTIDYSTRDIDFGQPGVQKKFYKVKISYKGDASSLNVKYSVNGSSTLKQFNSDDTPLSNAGTTEWTVAELTPSTSSEANNINSIQLHFDGTVASDFEINDISFIYRGKNVK
tara:strand:+ start:297 stop:2657 length:2361 start_codon:yes stop_codon:yes gene_type:complete